MHISKRVQFDLFESIVRNAIAGYATCRKDLDFVIRECILFARKKKDVFQIDREYFTIIYYLGNNYPEYFKNLTLKNQYGKKEYKKIQGYIKDYSETPK